MVLALISGLEARSTMRAEKPAMRNSRAFGLEEILMGEFSSRGFSANWISGTEFLYTDRETGNVMKYDVESKSNDLFVERAILEEYQATSYELSHDRNFLLMGYDTLSGFRHSTASRFVLYDLVNKLYHDIEDKNHLQLVRLQPNGNGLVYVYDNDIYFLRTLGSDGKTRLTYTGVPGIIYNGVPDWVYEEEVLGSGSALWFSANGESLAYASFDDTEVATESYVEYGNPGDLNSQYSQTHNIKYPKPGTRNPAVTLHVIDLVNVQPEYHNELPFPPNNDNLILFAVTWTTPTEIAAVWTNRIQNSALTRIYTARTGVYDDVHRKTEYEGWLDVVTPLFDYYGQKYVTILPQPQGDAGNYRQLTLVEVSTGIEYAMSRGRSVVTAIYGWDYLNNIVYFQSTLEDQPSQRHVFSVAGDGSTDPICLSCNVVSPEGNTCKYAYASFSNDMSHMALTCSGPDPIYVMLFRNTDHTSEMWENNQALRTKLLERDLPETVDTDVQVESGYTAKARLWLPPGMDKSGATKYPMLVYVYGGPNSVQISDSFTLGFGAYLTTNRSIIYALIDGRGSGLKGDTMKFSIYKKLGTYEVLDQIAVTMSLQARYRYIDRTRTAIWGWSYGGYATAMAMARDSLNVFKCGAAVAPVTSWIYYDTIYTERYMGLPTEEDNLKGYDNADVTRLVTGFRGKQFYLLHGNADDNVHYIQAMMLSRALEVSNILFRQQSYPDENHSLGSVLLHVYGSMDQFWTQCFDLFKTVPASSFLFYES
ncbi:hypothetical protein L9F63_002551, partial [Diploptera punctata]